MSKEHKRTLPNPTLEELQRELERVKRKQSGKRGAIFATAAACVVIASVVLIAYALPVMRIHGTSMLPTLEQGDVIVALRGDDLSSGDLVAFEYGSKILVKRVIACSGDLVEIDDDGVVFVNHQELSEPYVYERVSGTSDIEQPYRVAMNEYFVLGDHRGESVDSRHEALGCVTKEQVIGRVCFRIWPIEQINIW